MLPSVNIKLILGWHFGPLTFMIPIYSTTVLYDIHHYYKVQLEMFHSLVIQQVSRHMVVCRAAQEYGGRKHREYITKSNVQISACS